MKIFQLPAAISYLALRRQEQAGNVACEDLDILTKKKDGGFDWHDTPEGVHFWAQIHKGDFSVYFKQYDFDSLADRTIKEAQINLSEHSEEELRRALKKVLSENLIA